MLEINNLKTLYGHVVALEEVSLQVKSGQIVSIIGSNGAGKTTLLNTISGLVPPAGGEIRFNNRRLQQVPHRVVAGGIVQVPEGRKVFSGLTVHENLLMGGYLTRGKQLQDNLNWVYALFPRLKERGKQHAGTLSGGEQQMLAIGRGLMSNPKLMLLDEPSLGLAPQIVNSVFKLIATIRENGITVVLVEQNAKKALTLCDYAYVLENGRIVMSGAGEDLLHDPKITAAYLGKGKEEN